MSQAVKTAEEKLQEMSKDHMELQDLFFQVRALARAGQEYAHWNESSGERKDEEAFCNLERIFSMIHDLSSKAQEL